RLLRCMGGYWKSPSKVPVRRCPWRQRECGRRCYSSCPRYFARRRRYIVRCDEGSVSVGRESVFPRIARECRGIEASGRRRGKYRDLGDGWSSRCELYHTGECGGSIAAIAGILPDVD